jgi:hypothetical protein
VFEGLLSEGNEECRGAGRGIPKTSPRQHYNTKLFLKDLPNSEQSQSSLHDSFVREPTSIGYHDGENSIIEVSYALSVPSASSRPLSYSMCVSEETAIHSGGCRTRKMTLDSTDPEIMTEKKRELSDRDQDNNLLFLKSLFA